MKKLVVGQFNVVSKDLEHNYQMMKSLINQAIAAEYEMIVFPEYALVGYGCADVFLDEGFIKDVEAYHNKMRDLADNIDVIFGSIFKGEGGLQTGAVIIQDKIMTTSAKENLKKSEFDEKRYFVSGKNTSISFNNKKYRITFLEDFENNPDEILLGSLSYPHQPAQKLKVAAFANSSGITMINKYVFINHGLSFTHFNRKLMVEDEFKAGLTTQPKSNDYSKLELLTATIKEWDQQNFNAGVRWIVGNSGGIDSALTIALLVMALGSKRVVTYNLASQYNSNKTINNASQLAQKLKIKHVESNIETLTRDTLSLCHHAGYTDEYPSLVEENIQARLRGHVLSTFAALEGGVVCNNGNKVELALGYCTLYGDTIGALSPIGDLLKVELFDLAKAINTHYQDEIIPVNLIPIVKNYQLEWDLPPTAELKEAQVDPMKWYYHDLLLNMYLQHGEDFIISEYAKNKLSDYEVGQWLDVYGLLDTEAFIEDLEWFVRTVQINQFKRIQTPPLIVMSEHVINYDHLESPGIKPKSETYKKIRHQLLNK